MPEDESPMAADADTGMEISSGSESENEEPVEMLVTGRAKRSTAGNRMSAMIGEVAADDELELLFAEDEEAGPDEEFEEEVEEGASDNDMGDSSDDEDQGPTAATEDLEGEKEIEKQTKEERKRKRKAQRAFTKPTKRMKHTPFSGSAAPAVPASKAKKKAERMSWIPDLGAGTRTSKRETTTQQSEALRTKIVAREKDREEQVKRLEEKARRREANKPKALTQEDRLREAAEVEKENLKSLNRWEEIERERQEEQRKRLEALQNRQLSGPVITYWSGPARWIGERLTAVGSEKVKRALATQGTKDSDTKQPATANDLAKEEGATNDAVETGGDRTTRITEEGEAVVGEHEAPADKDQTRRPSSKDLTMRPKSSGSISVSSHSMKPSAVPEVPDRLPLEDHLQEPRRSTMSSASPRASSPATTHEPVASEGPEKSPHPSAQTALTPSAQSASPPPSLQPPKSTLERPSPLSQRQDSEARLSQALDRQSESTQRQASEVSMSASPAPSSHLQESHKTGFIKQEPSASGTATPTSIINQGGAQQIVFSINTPPPTTTASLQAPGASRGPLVQTISSSTGQLSQPSQLPTGPPPPPPKPVIATRNLVSLVNVDLSNPNSSTLPKELQGSLLVTSSKAAKQKKTAKPPPPPTCSVTGLQIKYRDPQTGIGYANPYAYRQLKSVRNGRLMWNEVTNTYAGPAPRVADGVPDEFLKAMKAGQAKA